MRSVADLCRLTHQSIFACRVIIAFALTQVLQKGLVWRGPLHDDRVQRQGEQSGVGVLITLMRAAIGKPSPSTSTLFLTPDEPLSQGLESKHLF